MARGLAAANNKSAYKPLFKPFVKVGKSLEKANDKILSCLCD